MTTEPPRDPTKPPAEPPDETSPATDDARDPNRKGMAEAPQPFLADDELTSGVVISTQADDPKEIGVSVIKNVIKTIGTSPGVYRMLNAAGDVLYVGKAKNLKNRVTSYTHPDRLSIRIARVVAATASMDVVTTRTEAEALLLENNLIKKLKPRYNVLLRDDKSFPYILITGDTEWPRITKYRGAQNQPGEYFGPFASAGAVNHTLATLERAFPLRSCSDSVFSTRTRPCLQYQIKRCTAPCVGRIDKPAYEAIVGQARRFLNGRSHDIQKALSADMTVAAEALDYEGAAILRDRIRALSQIQSRQDIHIQGLGEADVMAVHVDGGQCCIQVFFFRAGQNLGNRSYFPSQTANLSPEDILEAFVGQFYAGHPPPRLILTSHKLPGAELMAEALAIKADRKVAIGMPERGNKRKLIEHALANAAQALARRMAESATQRKLLEGVGEIFGLDGTPERIEVYDNSHISGTNAIGAMIVAGPDGLMKNAWRKFTIRSVLPTGHTENSQGGDDYAMMREVLTRRFARALKEDPERNKGQWPDLVLIDGGAGQLKIACEVFADLGVTDVALVGVAKGPDRNAGRERFFMPGREPFSLEMQDPVLYFLQRLRDEAHRFAIGGHRAKRSAAIGKSQLDEIAGIGATRKRALLHHFGSARGVAEAGLPDLESVQGISKAVAKKIYDHFHSGT